MIGKNFSANNATGKRKKSDFYETPYSMTRQLLELELFNYGKCVLEPACGNGAIVKVLQKYWWNNDNIIANDIDINGVDFLTYENKVPYLITNPPFSLAFEFIQRAKEIVTDKFCLLLPLSYLHGKKRYDYIWNDTVFPLKKVYIFTRYPLLGEALRDDGKYNTGMMVYAWYVWSRYYESQAYLDWIDNSDYILKKGD